MFRKTHEAEIAEYIADLKRANEARDNWRDSSKEWEAKFKTAATDLGKQADEIGRLKAEHAEAVRWATTNEIDATLWRNAREKRAKNRGGGK